MKWLITAFEPFDKAESNSSIIVARELEKLDWGGNLRFHYPVPVTYSGAWASVEAAVRAFPEADGILALGQSEARDSISLERVALNMKDARIPDNSGAQPSEEKIQAEGPDVLWSPIPWRELKAIPGCGRSYSAGTFVCNSLMYQILDWAKQQDKSGGFIHIPILQSQNEAQFSQRARLPDGDAVAALAKICEFLIKL